MSYQQHSICAPTISCHKCGILMALPIYTYHALPVLCLYKSAVLYPQISAAHPTSLSLKLIGISSGSSRDCIFFLFAAARARQESINIKEGLEGRGNPLFVLDPLYSVQLIENSGGISAMMVIQFSKETHFLQRERESLAAAVRRSGSVKGKDFLSRVWHS